MKLLSLHIENYGKISKRDFTFNDKITSLCEENGFGKTTLASFIKAMFYGLDPYRANSKEFSERQHFYPFGGGAFGGNLTFSMDGKTYKIERFFGEKSDTQDEVKVYCNGTLTGELGADIGKAVFGIDRQSFERTAYVTAADTEISSTTGINAKLNNFLDGTEDIDLDRAVKVLEAESKRYKKSRTGNDLITAEKTAIEKLDYDITNAKNTETALAEKNRRYEALGAEISSLEARVTSAQTRNIVLRDWEYYDKLLKRAEEAKADEAKLAGQFSAGVPEEAELAEAEKNINLVSSLEAEIKVLENRTPDERSLKLRQKFSVRVPDESELNAAGEKLEAYKAAERKYEDTPAFVAEVQTKLKPKTKYAIIALAAGALIAAGGVALIFVNTIVGAILTVLGGIALVAGGFLWLDKKNLSDSVIQSENPEKQRTRKQADELSDAVKAFLLPYGYASGNGIVFDFAKIREDVIYFKNILEEEQKTAAAIERKTAQKSNCTRDISGFFAKFGLYGDNYLGNLSRLRSGITAYKASGGEVSRSIAEAEKFKAEKNLVARPEGSAEDIGGLNAELNRLRGQRSDLYRDICEDERTSEQCEIFENEKASHAEKLEEYKKKYELLTATAAFLKQAEQNLKDKYVKPVKDEFVRYSELIERTLGEKVEMNKDFEISFERGGKLRPDGHLSAGQRSICALCFRLALIKNMYSTQPPFLILDDPFVHLDGVHLEKVKSVIEELSADMQIIYFSCHESRAL